MKAYGLKPKESFPNNNFSSKRNKYSFDDMNCGKSKKQTIKVNIVYKRNAKKKARRMAKIIIQQNNY